jgi:hypothetical protein
MDQPYLLQQTGIPLPVSFLISEDMIFNRLSNVRLLLGIFIRPLTTTSLGLYWQQFMLRKVCNALLESCLNHHILTIKHLRITVGEEYTWGLPRFRGGDKLDHSIQPIRYRMLKSMDSFNQDLIFGTVVNKIIFQRLALSCCIVYHEIIWIMILPHLYTAININIQFVYSSTYLSVNNLVIVVYILVYSFLQLLWWFLLFVYMED